jgi:prefoldin subunit 5
MRRLSEKIEKLEDAIRALTKQLQQTLNRHGPHQE